MLQQELRPQEATLYSPATLHIVLHTLLGIPQNASLQSLVPARLSRISSVPGFFVLDYSPQQPPPSLPAPNTHT